MEKVTIKNRKNQNLVLLLEIQNPQKGLCFIAHGLGGFKEQPHIQTYAESFFEEGFSVIRFDTTNTVGESDGKYEDATVTNYFEDLEDIINWAKDKDWYEEPFVLAGHSLGGLTTLLFAEKYPDKVKAIAPTSTVVSGKYMRESFEENYLKEWEQTGWNETLSKTRPGMVKRLKWSFIEDCLNYDTLTNVEKLTIPVLLLVGDLDKTTPPSQQKILYDAIPGNKKELHIVEGSPHTFKDPERLKELKQIFKNWIEKSVL